VSRISERQKRSQALVATFSFCHGWPWDMVADIAGHLVCVNGFGGLYFTLSPSPPFLVALRLTLRWGFFGLSFCFAKECFRGAVGVGERI